MFSANKLTQYAIWITIICVGVFAWIYDYLFPNGDIIGLMFIFYGLFRVYTVYKSE